MAWIHTIPDEDATGALANIYAAARQRAGRVFEILRVQSLNSAALEASIQQYLALMFGESPLTRAQREMLAVVVSRANRCHYWVEAHALDLRSEANSELSSAVKAAGAAALNDPPDRALATFAEKLTRQSSSMSADDVQSLRDAGFNDRAIHDAVQVIAYFNYINRVADGLGVDLEPGMPARESS